MNKKIIKFELSGNDKCDFCHCHEEEGNLWALEGSKDKLCADCFLNALMVAGFYEVTK